MSQTIVNMHRLVSDIADQLSQQRFHHTNLACIEVELREEGKPVLRTSLATALGHLANDVYWDEETDWSNADEVEVRVL